MVFVHSKETCEIIPSTIKPSPCPPPLPTNPLEHMMEEGVYFSKVLRVATCFTWATSMLFCDFIFNQIYS